jgi:hypothetical protein
VVVDPEAGFSLTDIAPTAQWVAVLSSVIAPAVVWHAVTGAVLGLLPGGLAALGALELLSLPTLPHPSSVSIDDLSAARTWLSIDLDRALGTGVEDAPIVHDVMKMGAHRNPSHLSALVLAIVVVANAAAAP